MANKEKKGGFFSRLRKQSTEESQSKIPQAKPAEETKPVSSKPPVSKPSPVKATPVDETTEQTRSDALEPVDTAASIDNFFKTMLHLSVEHLKMADNTIKAATENLDKLTQSLKGKHE
ncbi:hypothetical protein [Prosthecochloris sp.]|jgi:hypothetical protein|uniref:hypothetical protein n=1 Tax=Prosthecochloris sp. TaxID=290513 RepID=UPI0025CEDBF1|nr:hypothetical protein [Prosthecochloris sp.]